MGFSNSVVGGITLVRPAIRSPNYVTGSTGWTINADGTAEFNSITARGTVVVGNAVAGGSGETITTTIPAELATAYPSMTVVRLFYSNSNTLYFYEGVAAAVLYYGLVDTGTVYEAYREVTTGTGPNMWFGQVNKVQFNIGPNDGSNNSSSLILGGVDITIDSACGPTWTTYTPTVGNGGTVTWTTITGRWKRISAKTVAVDIYLVVNGAGSGAGNITVTTPTNPLRTLRQTIHGSSESATISICMISFTGGAGAVWDRVRDSAGTNLTGAALTAGRILNLQGIYEEA